MRRRPATAALASYMDDASQLSHTVGLPAGCDTQSLSTRGCALPGWSDGTAGTGRPAAADRPHLRPAPGTRTGRAIAQVATDSTETGPVTSCGTVIGQQRRLPRRQPPRRAAWPHTFSAW